MENFSVDIIGLIYQLLPGFIVAWTFYGLTSYIKPSPFEQIIQALIFTVFTKVFLIICKTTLIFIGKYWLLGNWSSNVELVISIIIAVFFGIIISWCVNNDFPLWMFRNDSDKKGFFGFLNKIFSKINLTNKTLHPTEWYSFFRDFEGYSILHLEGERRLQGSVIQFPDSPNNGHFIIMKGAWLLDDGTVVPLLTVDKTLINSSEVLRVELLKNEEFDAGEILKQNDPIHKLYKKGD